MHRCNAIKTNNPITALVPATAWTLPALVFNKELYSQPATACARTLKKCKPLLTPAQTTKSLIQKHAIWFAHLTTNGLSQVVALTNLQTLIPACVSAMKLLAELTSNQLASQLARVSVFQTYAHSHRLALAWMHVNATAQIKKR